mmetsp:Transcript_85120/g.183510  ORF Transcript_85120/g.183510 Transcript_85120/m.183510 type:complete len:194 (+) Transcript_85120:146-727(+)
MSTAPTLRNEHILASASLEVSLHLLHALLRQLHQVTALFATAHFAAGVTLDVDHQLRVLPQSLHHIVTHNLTSIGDFFPVLFESDFLLHGVFQHVQNFGSLSGGFLLGRLGSCNSVSLCLFRGQAGCLLSCGSFRGLTSSLLFSFTGSFFSCGSFSSLTGSILFGLFFVLLTGSGSGSSSGGFSSFFSSLLLC